MSEFRELWNTEWVFLPSSPACMCRFWLPLLLSQWLRFERSTATKVKVEIIWTLIAELGGNFKQWVMPRVALPPSWENNGTASTEWFYRSCVGGLRVQHLPVESRLLALALLPNTESKSTLRPREFCCCWRVGEVVNPGEAKRKPTIRRYWHDNSSIPPNTTTSR